jgi:hypothetical protein
MAEVGYILEIIKTKNPDNTNEYLILSNSGMFFVTIVLEKRAGKILRFSFEFNFDESYFVGSTVKGAFEYNIGKFITLVNGSKNIRFIDRA